MTINERFMLLEIIRIAGGLTAAMTEILPILPDEDAKERFKIKIEMASRSFQEVVHLMDKEW
jgi:hypothetical protein